MREKKMGWERMTKQMSLTCKPSVFEKIKKIAYVQGIPINRALNIALDEFISNHQMDIEQYNQIEKEMSNND